MSQRNSGRERIARDAYNTPRWVTDVLSAEIVGPSRLPRGSTVWECAAGTGQMVEGLQAAGFNVVPSDIVAASPNILVGDFLKPMLPFAFDGIFTNPPYNRAEEFVRQALALTQPSGGMVAMLLDVRFDSAKTRRDLFADHPAWGTKIVLLDRITWFEPQPGDNSPSENHAWYVWDWRGRDGRTLRYASAPQDVLDELSAKRRGKPARGAS